MLLFIQKVAQEKWHFFFFSGGHLPRSLGRNFSFLLAQKKMILINLFSKPLKYFISFFFLFADLSPKKKEVFSKGFLKPRGLFS